MNIEIKNRKFELGSIEHELKDPSQEQINRLGACFEIMTKGNVLLFFLNDFSINGETFNTIDEVENKLKTI